METSSAKFSATTNFLFSLSSFHTLNKGIFHDITTVGPLFSGHLLSGHPPLSSHFPKSRIIVLSVECCIRYLYSTANLYKAASFQSPQGGRLIEVRLYIKRQQQKNPRGIDRSNDPCTRLTVLNQRIAKSFCFRPLDTKVKCPTRRASFWVKFPTVRSLTRNASQISGDCPGGMGGFGIAWYITYA